MATSTIDGTVEEVVIKRRRSQGSVYERVKFRLDDGRTETVANAHALNNVGALLVPGTRGRFYLYKAIDHRGVSGVRTEDGQEAFGVAMVNEYVGIGVVVFNLLLTILYLTIFDDVSDFPRIVAAVLVVLGIPMYFHYRQIRVDAEKAFRADTGFRPAVRAA